MSYFFSSKVRYVCMLLYLHCHISSPQSTIRLHVALSSLSYFFSSKVRYVCMLLYLHCHISSPQSTIRLHVALSSLSYFFSSKVRYVCMLLYLHCHISSPQRYDTFACCFIFIVIFLLLKGTIRLHVALSSLSYFFSSKVRYVCMLLYLHCHISSPQRYDTFACCFIFIVIFLLLKGTIRLHVALSSLSYFFSSKVRYVCMLLYLHCHISSPQRYDTFACCFIFIVIFLLLKGTIRLHVALS